MAHVKDVESRLSKIDGSRRDDNDIHSMFRAVHSIKGTAVFFGLNNIVDLAHDIESVFGEIRNGKLRISNGIADIILSALDCLRLMLTDALNSENIDALECRRGLTAILEGNLPERQQKPAKNRSKEKRTNRSAGNGGCRQRLDARSFRHR